MGRTQRSQIRENPTPHLLPAVLLFGAWQRSAGAHYYGYGFSRTTKTLPPSSGTSRFCWYPCCIRLSRSFAPLVADDPPTSVEWVFATVPSPFRITYAGLAMCFVLFVVYLCLRLFSPLLSGKWKVPNSLVRSGSKRTFFFALAKTKLPLHCVTHTAQGNFDLLTDCKFPLKAYTHPLTPQAAVLLHPRCSLWGLPAGIG